MMTSGNHEMGGWFSPEKAEIKSEVVAIGRMRMGSHELRREQRTGCNEIRSSWTTFESPERSNNE
jgi:hypothetical protein